MLSLVQAVWYRRVGAEDNGVKKNISKAIYQAYLVWTITHHAGKNEENIIVKLIKNLPGHFK